MTDEYRMSCWMQIEEILKKGHFAKVEYSRSEGIKIKDGNTIKLSIMRGSSNGRTQGS